MGFLKFLSSKKSPDKSANGIKAQAYTATTASLPPLLGTYPVAGNGPTNVFETLQRSHHKISETNLSLAAASDYSAPAPPVPRFRDASVERPSSAPYGAGPNSSPSSRGGRDSSRGPPLSFRKPRMGSVTSLTSGLSPTPKRSNNSPAIPFEGDPFRSPSAPFSHSRHVSMHGNGALAKGFIDILDAQSEIKPSGFQNRVKASGARDYGEDVADRNIGENGVDLTSERVQAFYASNNGGSPQNQLSEPVRPGTAMAHFRDKGQTYSPSQRHNPMEMEARTKSLTSASQAPFRTTIFSPERSYRQEPIMEDPEPVRGRRRQSLGAYVPSVPSALEEEGSIRLQRSAFDAPGTSSARQHKRRSTLGGEAPFNELGIFTQPVRRTAVETPLSPKTSSQKPVYVVRHNYSLPVQQRLRTSAEAQTESYHHAVRPPSRGGSVASSKFSSPTQKPPSKRHSMPGMGGVVSTLLDELPRNARASDAEDDTRGWVGRVEVESFVDSADVSSPAPSPHVMRSGHSWRETLDNSVQKPKLLGSPYGKSKLDEIDEHVPMRTSSLRPCSMTSTTPTMSSSSSFLRPVSRHTTTTSVDLATTSSCPNDSHSSLHSGTCDQHSFRTALESALPSPMDSAGLGVGYNIDDYLSSDDDTDADSFITSRHRDWNGGNEEDLLFSNLGYGQGGLQLPGLFDGLPNVPDPDTTSPERPGSALRYSSLSNPGRFSRRLSLDPRIEAPTLPLDMLDEDEDEDDMYDIPTRSDLALGRRGTRRISALGTMYQSIEEEKGKVDVRAAVRLRKEDKARQRAMARFGRVKNKRATFGGDETEQC
ncbi:hypothetical protein CCHL11_07288 [Colletotrichum chlorophyti]|uniref:Uncharacterized protein n=1 Tax=Colletotrichum chlorophyti TaxID=708187 RepID=A0A1Q8RA05_9PEZI|nr:hypothetical protein CCHL11_07288 [Colletotrichum chlorophyti]